MKILCQKSGAEGVELYKSPNRSSQIRDSESPQKLSLASDVVKTRKVHNLRPAGRELVVYLVNGVPPRCN